MKDVLMDVVLPVGGSLLGGVLLTLTAVGGIQKWKDGHVHLFSCSYSKENIEAYLKSFKDDNDGRTAKNTALDAIVGVGAVDGKVTALAAQKAQGIASTFDGLTQEEKNKATFAGLTQEEKNKATFDGLTQEEKNKATFDGLTQEEKNKATFDGLTQEEKNKATFDGLTQEEKNKATFDGLTQEEKNKATFAGLTQEEKNKAKFADLAQAQKDAIKIANLPAPEKDKLNGADSLYAKAAAARSASNTINPANLEDIGDHAKNNVTILQVLESGKEYDAMGNNCKTFVKTRAEASGYENSDKGAKEFLAAMKVLKG